MIQQSIQIKTQSKELTIVILLNILIESTGNAHFSSRAPTTTHGTVYFRPRLRIEICSCSPELRRWLCMATLQCLSQLKKTPVAQSHSKAVRSLCRGMLSRRYTGDLFTINPLRHNNVARVFLEDTIPALYSDITTASQFTLTSVKFGSQCLPGRWLIAFHSVHPSSG